MDRETSDRLARALATELACTVEPLTADLLIELLMAADELDGDWTLLAHETGWHDLVWRALEVAELAELEEAP